MNDLRNKFNCLLNKISVRSEDLGDSGIDLLVKFLRDNTPSKCFRYRSCSEKNISAFEEDKIFLVLPKFFNDPYDCLPFINKEFIKENFLSAYSIRGIKEIRKTIKKDPYSKPACFFRQLYKENYDHFINILEKYDDAFLLDCQGYIKCLFEDLDVLLEKEIIVAKNKIQEKSYIACFSEINDSILMWSHYADSHEGFVLEYSTLDLFEAYEWAGGMLYPIIYSNERYDYTEKNKYMLAFGFFNNFNLINFDKALLYKSINWEYEKEWRLIIPRGVDISDHKVICCKPKAIYYGEKILEEHKNKLHKIALEKGIDEYQAQLDYFSPDYKMIFAKYE